MIYDAAEICKMLNADAERFCNHFLTGGRRFGHEWRCSDIHCSKAGGKSFVVELDGSKAGLWYENGTVHDGPKSGGLLDILMVKKGCNKGQAIQAAKDWLGIKDEVKRFRPLGAQQKNTPRQEYISTKHLTRAKEGTPAWNYLVNERGISPEVLEKYPVYDCEAWFQGAQGKLPAIAFVAKSPDGEKVLNIKYLALQRSPEGKKYIAQEQHGTNHLIFMNCVDKNAKTLVICEGEIDALTAASAGCNVVSVPAGAHTDTGDGAVHKNNVWLENDYEYLASFEEIKLVFDNDEPGVLAAKSLFFRLGIHRTSIANIPQFDLEDGKTKDINSLAKYASFEGQDFSTMFNDILENAKGHDPDTLKHSMDYYGAVYELFFPKGGKPFGEFLPNCNFGEHFMIRPGELTVLTGFASHGKTEFLNELLVGLTTNGDRAVVASLETPPQNTLSRMWCQSMGLEKPIDWDEHGNKYEIPGLFEKGMRWLDERIHFYDFVGVAESKKVIPVFEYAAKRYGAKYFVVDSLMCMDVAEDDFNRQKEIMNELCAFVRKYNVHLFLVCHAKKTTDKKREESYIPGKHDISGSGHIGNLAFNIISVWRNISKSTRYEQLMMKAKQAHDATAKKEFERRAREVWDEHDAVVSIKKQRNGKGELPLKHLWFDPSCRQYRSKKSDKERNYINKTNLDKFGDSEPDQGELL